MIGLRPKDGCNHSTVQTPLTCLRNEEAVSSFGCLGIISQLPSDMAGTMACLCTVHLLHYNHMSSVRSHVTLLVLWCYNHMPSVRGHVTVLVLWCYNHTRGHVTVLVLWCCLESEEAVSRFGLSACYFPASCHPIWRVWWIVSALSTYCIC